MQPIRLDDRSHQAFQSLIQIGQTSSTDNAKLGVDERLGYIVIHSESKAGKTDLPIKLIQGAEIFSLLDHLNFLYQNNNINEDFYLQVLQGARKLAETQADPTIMQAAVSALRILKETPRGSYPKAVNPQLLEKAQKIIETSPLAIPSPEVVPWRKAIEAKTANATDRGIIDSLKDSARRMWMNKHTVQASDALIAFLPPGVGNLAEIDEKMKLIVKDEKGLKRFLNVLNSIAVAKEKNIEMLRKGIPPTSTDPHVLIAADKTYTLISDLSQEIGDAGIMKPLNHFLQSVMEQAAPMNYQTISDIFMLGVHGVAIGGTELRSVERKKELQSRIQEFPPELQELINDDFHERDVGFNIWERAVWKPLVEIPLNDGNRILLKGAIEGEFVRPGKAVTDFSVPVDLTNLDEMEFLRSLKYEDYQKIFQFLKSFACHPQEKTIPKYRGDKKSIQIRENDGQYIENERENLPFLNRFQYDRLVGIAYNLRSQIEKEMYRGTLNVNNPTLKL